MAVGIGTRFGRRQGEGRTVGAALRAAGRVALWALIALLLIRGGASVLSPPAHGEGQPAVGRAGVDPATAAFAVRFARAYLGGSSPPELAVLRAPGVRGVSGATGNGVTIAQAEVAGVQSGAGGQAIVTVACELGDARTIFLAVPIVREDAGEVAATGAPAVVAGPAGVGEGVEAPQPLAGPGATAIGDLVRRFLPAYFSASGPGDLSYLLAPGAEVIPPGNGLQSLGVPAVKQIGDGEGARRTVLASVRVRDPLSGEVFQLGYRLEVSRRGRWYVDRVEGALS